MGKPHDYVIHAETYRVISTREGLENTLGFELIDHEEKMHFNCSINGDDDHDDCLCNVNLARSAVQAGWDVVWGPNHIVPYLIPPWHKSQLIFTGHVSPSIQ